MPARRRAGSAPDSPDPAAHAVPRPEQRYGATASPAPTRLRPRGAPAGATTAALAVDSAAIRSGRRASKLIGSSVYNESNESIGEVDDILIPPGGGGGRSR